MPSELPVRALACFLLSGLLQQPAAVRVTDSSSVSADVQESTEECAEQLRTIYRSVTYRDLYSPLLDGAYRIRNRFSGEYLAAAKDGYAGTTLYHVNSGELSDWRLKRVKVAGMPVYTLRNRKSNQYLVVQGVEVKTRKEVDDSGHWSLALASDGVHRIIRLPLNGSNGDLALTGESSELTFAEHSGTEESLDSLKGEWFLEARTSWWRIPKSDSNGYEDQWKVAGDIPIFPGTEYTWLNMCETEGVMIDCAAAYAGGRQNYKDLGVVSETSRRYVTQNILTGNCEMSFGPMKYLFASAAELLVEMRKAAGSACAAKSVKETSTDLTQAMMAECFDACLASIRVVVDDLPCEKPENVTALFENILSHNTCDKLDASTLEGLTDFAVMERCLTWHPPSPLWTAELHGKLSLTSADGTAVCAMRTGKESSRNSRDLFTNQANGVCVSGTTCQCPQDFLKQRDSTMGLVGGSMYIASGSSAEAIVRDQLFKQARSVALRVFILGYSVTGAVAAIPFSITFIPRQIMAWGGWVIDAVRWTCEETAGCWPIEPERTKTEESKKACRLPDAAKAGGSLVWFMPPPGVLIRGKKWYNVGRRCEFAACSRNDLFSSRVGFGGEGKANVYNCQVLPYEEMTVELQQAYLEKLRDTLPAEYAGEI